MTETTTARQKYFIPKNISRAYRAHLCEHADQIRSTAARYEAQLLASIAQHESAAARHQQTLALLAHDRSSLDERSFLQSREGWTRELAHARSRIARDRDFLAFHRAHLAYLETCPEQG